VKRLRKLEQQAATFGNQTPIHILTEIDDLTEAIEEIDAKISPILPDTRQAESISKRPVQGTPIPAKLGPVRLVAAEEGSARRRPLVPVVLSSIVIVVALALGFLFLKRTPTDNTTYDTSLPTAAIQKASSPPATLGTPLSGNIAGASVTPTSAVRSPATLETPLSGNVTEASVMATSAAIPTAQSSGKIEGEAGTTATAVAADSDAHLVRITELWGNCPITRVLPGYIHPDKDPVQALEQIRQALDTQDYRQWQEVPTSVKLDEFTMEARIASISQDIEHLLLSNTASVEVKTQAVPDHLDVFTAGQGCGAGLEKRFFPPIELNSNFTKYTDSVTYTKYDSFTLGPGEIEIFVFDFLCKQPGIYELKLTIPLTHKDKHYSVLIQSRYGYVCPKSYTSWTFEYSKEGNYFSSKNYAWNGEIYEEVP
jgi:hypothetical protein